MSSNPQQPSIINPVYLAGKLMLRGPAPITFTPHRHETRTTMSDLGSRVDRPYLGAGFANILATQSLGFNWADLRESGFLEHLEIIMGLGQPFDVCVWKQITEVFDGDGTNKTFYLRRRPADPVVSGLTGVSWRADYPAQVLSLSGPYGASGTTITDLTVTLKDNSSIDTSSPAAGNAWIDAQGQMVGTKLVSRMRLGTAPAAASDILVAIYLPLLRMAPDGDQPRSYQVKLVESHALKLIEV